MLGVEFIPGIFIVASLFCFVFYCFSRFYAFLAERPCREDRSKAGSSSSSRYCCCCCSLFVVCCLLLLLFLLSMFDIAVSPPPVLSLSSLYPSPYWKPFGGVRCAATVMGFFVPHPLPPLSLTSFLPPIQGVETHKACSICPQP